MSLLTSASRATKVVKNVGRMREIISAMSRFGFGTLVDRIGFGRFKSSHTVTGTDVPLDENSIPVRLRFLFEDLGPTFIKIGQIMASRPDLMPLSIVTEFSNLQDNVAPLPFSQIKPVIEHELGRSIENTFSSFDTEALASASIAQVHSARTLDGDDVVVKVLKPDVQKLLTQDIEILEMIIELSQKYVPELRPFRLGIILEEFKKSILNEINFTREATNVKRFRENFATSSFLVIPKVYTDLSSKRVLTQERIRGVKLSDLNSVRAMGVDTRDLLRQGMDCFYKSIMVDGFFHGDPHGGNILVLPDGRMGLIDFGSVGWLSFKSRSAIINMFMALISEDYDALVWEYLLLSPPSSGSRSSSKLEAIQSEVSTLFTPYHGLPIKEIPAGKILMDATSVAFKHQISLPPDLVLMFKAIMTLEGLGRQLDPDFDLVTAASRFSKDILIERYDPKRILKDLTFVGRDTARFLQTAPRQISETLRQMESGELTFQVNIGAMEAYTKAHKQAASKIAFALTTLGLLASSAYLTSIDWMPFWGVITLWIASGVAVMFNVIGYYKD